MLLLGKSPDEVSLILYFLLYYVLFVLSRESYKSKLNIIISSRQMLFPDTCQRNLLPNDSSVQFANFWVMRSFKLSTFQTDISC